MTRKSSLASGALVAVLAAVAATAGCASAGGSDAAAGASAAAASSQLDFGVDMARRGLWNEALFRFEQARRERPADAKVLNNLAVAYEAVGRFDEALAAYKEASRLAPGERNLKLNYSRFLEFYQGFRPPPATPPAVAPPAAPPATPPAGSAEAAERPEVTP